MARVRNPRSVLTQSTSKGSLLSPSKFAAIAERKDTTEQTDADYAIPKGLNLRDETARYFRIGQALFRSSTPRASRPFRLPSGSPRNCFATSSDSQTSSPLPRPAPWAIAPFPSPLRRLAAASLSSSCRHRHPRPHQCGPLPRPPPLRRLRSSGLAQCGRQLPLGSTHQWRVPSAFSR